MVSNCKQEIVEKWSTRDIDDIAPALLAKASNAFLDQCLALRLQTIDAKPLIQALAKAERLGYEPNDILLSEQQERVIPNTQLGHVPPVSTSASTARPTGAAVPRARPDQLQCLKCFRTFTKKSYFDFVSSCLATPPSRLSNGIKLTLGFSISAGVFVPRYRHLSKVSAILAPTVVKDSLINMAWIT
jgi:hypothetical protein